MPYRNAYAFVLALLALTFVAFWPTYLSDLPNANPAHHWHAGSSVLWTLLAALDNLGFAILFWGGLRYRYKVQLHARYMLGTVMFVVAPVFWRLLENYVPMFRETVMPFDVPFAIGNAAACVIALVLYRHAPRHGRPWLIVAAIIAAQTILFLTAGRLPGWAPIFASISQINLPLLLTLTGIVSLGIAWHGWVAGARPTAPEAAATA